MDTSFARLLAQLNEVENTTEKSTVNVTKTNTNSRALKILKAYVSSTRRISFDKSCSFKATVISDGMEAIDVKGPDDLRNSLSFIFPNDRRLDEVRRLLRTDQPLCHLLDVE